MPIQTKFYVTSGASVFDLGDLFDPISAGGAYQYATKYTVNGLDLSGIFYLSSGGGDTLSINTGYKLSDGTDLKNIFRRYGFVGIVITLQPTDQVVVNNNTATFNISATAPGTPTPEEYTKALGKVLKNLEKDSIFYTNQVAGIKANKKRTDLMIDATPKNEVDKENGLQKAALKEAIKGVIKNILSEGVNLSPEGPQMFEDEVYEMQGPKSDNEYKSELADYLEDNQIYGYTDTIHDIMTGPDEAFALDRLADYLKEEGIYGYTRAIEEIYADYPYDQHWQNQPDEDEDLPDEIPGFEGTRDALNNLFEDTEADRNMVRKFMTMYETEPSKFEKLHKQAQAQAATTNDIKFKHLLSLIDRAKAGALQSLANQDRYQAGIEGVDEGYDEDKLAKYEQYTYTLDGEVVEPEIAFFNNYIGAELDGQVYRVGIPDETGTVELRSHKGKTGMYTEDIFESVSLKDIL